MSSVHGVNYPRRKLPRCNYLGTIFLGGNCPGLNCLRGNFLKGNYPRLQLHGVGNYSMGIHPVPLDSISQHGTLQQIISNASFFNKIN